MPGFAGTWQLIVFTGLLALGACTDPDAFSVISPGKPNTQLRAEANTCDQASVGKPDHFNFFIRCLNNYGDTVRLADGRTYSPQQPATRSASVAPTTGTIISATGEQFLAPEIKEQYRNATNATIESQSAAWIDDKLESGSVYDFGFRGVTSGRSYFNFKYKVNNGEDRQADITFVDGHAQFVCYLGNNDPFFTTIGGQTNHVFENHRDSHLLPCYNASISHDDLRRAISLRQKREAERERGARALTDYVRDPRNYRQAPGKGSGSDCTGADWLYAPKIMGPMVSGVYLGGGCH